MAWSTVQLDANMGFTAALNEMLMQSFEETILVLPALPSRLWQGEVTHLLSRQGILVSMRWNMKQGWIEVRLENHHVPRTVQLKLPKGFICEDRRIQNELVMVDENGVILNFKS